MKTSEWLAIIGILALMSGGGIGFIFKLLWDIKSELVLIRMLIPSDTKIEDKIDKKILEHEKECPNKCR